MDLFQPKKKKPSELFGRAVLFGIFFVIVLIFFMTTSKHEKSIDDGSFLLNGLAKYPGFAETQKDSLKRRNAGFWHYASDTNTANPMIFMTDRFELKTNGIFWQVTDYTIGLPSMKSTRFMHIVTGYMNPFAKTGAGLDSIVCDVHIIRHAYVRGNDTCYGPSNFDTTWKVVANGRRFELGGNVYSPYDTSGHALFSFFPKGALAIVDKVKIYQCPRQGGFYFFLRNEVAADMRTVKVEALNTDGIQKIIDAYYRILLENTMKNALKADHVRSGSVKVTFDVTWDGKVANCIIIGLSIHNDQLKRQIAEDIGSWTFPQLKSPAAPQHVEREFWF